MAAAGEEDEKMSVQHILHSFDAGLNEEQAWAICFQCGRHLFRYRRSCQFSVNLDSVFVRDDGRVYLESYCNNSGRNEKYDEHELINLLGRTIFEALDYGLKEDEERELSTCLEELIDLMTNEDEIESISHNGEEEISVDEGIVDGHLEGDEEEPPTAETENSCSEGEEEKGELKDDDVTDVMKAILECSDGINADNGKITLVQILKLGARRLPDVSEAPGHYQQVCRALFTEVQELNSFLETISSGRKCLQKLQQIEPGNPENDGDCNELNELDTREWARMWIQLIKQLRTGVQLKKVGKINQRPIEYALTPYEILMDDIRSKRYDLNKIMVDGDIPPRVQREAHDVILDFIRSRPPLKAVSERKLNPEPPRRESVHDILIREIHSQPRLRPPEIKKGASTPALNQIGITEFEGSLQRNTLLTSSRKKILKEDIAFDWNHDSDSEDEAEKKRPSKKASREQMDESDDFKMSSFPDLSTLTEKKSNLRLNIARSPFQRSLANQNGGGLGGMRKQFRHSVMICEYHNVRKEPEDQPKRAEDDKPVAANSHPPKDFLSVTVDEVMHIRSVLVKVDIENLSNNKKLYKEVIKEKVCFLCHKKWSLFQRRYKCKLCKRNVCHGCCKKMQIPSDRFLHIPVNSLSPVSPSPSSPAAGHFFGGGTQSVDLGIQPHMGSSVAPHISTPTSVPAAEQKKDRREAVTGNTDVCIDCKEFMKQVLRSDNFQTKSLQQQQRLTHI